MKNKQMKITTKKFLCRISVYLICLFFLSCGLDVYYVIYPPTYRAIPSETDPSLRFFSFNSADSYNNQTTDIDTLGTAVYYRIYNNLDKLTSDTSQIQSSNTEYSENGYNKMETLKYQEIACTNGNRPLIKSGNVDDKQIHIRLFTEGGYNASVEVYNKDTDKWDIDGIPLRTMEKEYSFEFSDSEIPKPTIDDIDTELSTTYTEKGFWYVNAFAYSACMDVTFATKKSQLIYLGYIKISESK